MSFAVTDLEVTYKKDEIEKSKLVDRIYLPSDWLFRKTGFLRGAYEGKDLHFFEIKKENM